MIRHDMFSLSNRASAVLFACFALVGFARSASVDMVLNLANPILSTTSNVEINVALPERIAPADVLDAGALRVQFDVEKQVYRIVGSVPLAPGTNAVLRVRLKDVWSISDAEIDAMLKQARALVDMHKGRDSFDEANAQLIGDEGTVGIEKKLEKVRASQQQYAIRPGLKTSSHITAYEQDLKVWIDVTRQVRHLENLALKEGMDLESLVWDREVGPQESRVLLPEAYKSAAFVVKVTNPADWDRTENVERALPPDVTGADILDAGGLDVMIKDGRTLVVTNDLALTAGQEINFAVQIRDKWDINAPRVATLETLVSNTLNQVRQINRYPKLIKVLEGLETELQAVKAEVGPATFDADYVAFFHGQAQRMDVLEHKIRRIASALNPQLRGQKLGFDVKPPSSKSTWVLIYSILGFLALMSILFFARWFGKQDEKPVTFVGGKDEGGEKKG